RPCVRDAALAGLLEQSQQDAPNVGNPRMPDDGNAARLAAFFADPRPVIAYVGKISQEKGVPLLIDVVKQLGLRAVIVGFGPARTELEGTAGPDILFTGALEHRHLRYLWPLCATSVVPSVFPEAFGIGPAAEAASCVAVHRWWPTTPAWERSPPVCASTIPRSSQIWPRSRPATPRHWQAD
ncbi:MAG: glycosyltransferase, partial [Candidatus Nanopelagicales bacterium]